MIFAMHTIFQILSKNQLCFKNPDNPSCTDFVFNKPSKMFSRHYDYGNRDLRFQQNGNYSFEIILQEKKTKIIHYRNYKTFNANLFKEELNNELLRIVINNAELVEFTNTALSILNKHAPIKRKYIRANNPAFMKRTQSSNNAKV